MDELARMDADLESLAMMQRQNPRATPPLPATFEVEALYDDAESKRTGKPVYRDREMVTIKVGALDTVRREVTDDDKRTYAAQYVAWKKSSGPDEGIEGFPLSQWAQIPGKAVVKTFAAYEIRAVEQLANVTDSVLERIGPYKQLRQLARDWVADAQKQAPLVKLRAENEELRGRVTALEQMVKEAQKSGVAGGAPDTRVSALEAQLAEIASLVKQQAAPKRRGRPPKVKPEPAPEA